MSEQPILEGCGLPRHEDWEHVAREFHDHDLEHEGGWNPSTTMEPVGSAYYVGDWLPAEPICKEVVRLRRALGGEAMSKKLEQEFDQFRKLVASYMECIAGVPMRAVDVDQDEEEDLADEIYRYLKRYDGEEEKR